MSDRVIRPQAVMAMAGSAGARAVLDGAGGSLGLAGLTLAGSTVLLVERDPEVAEALQVALELAGAEVLIAATAAKALQRMAQFDFSAAVVDGCPEAGELRVLMRRLQEDGVRVLFRTDAGLRADGLAQGEPVVLKSAPQHELVAALAQLMNTMAEIDDAETVVV